MEKSLKIQICSDVDYENLIAEIYCGEEFIALINQEAGANKLVVEFSDVANSLRSFEYEWLMAALQMAKDKLLARQ